MDPSSSRKMDAAADAAFDVLRRRQLESNQKLHSLESENRALKLQNDKLQTENAQLRAARDTADGDRASLALQLEASQRKAEASQRTAAQLRGLLSKRIGEVETICGTLRTEVLSPSLPSAGEIKNVDPSAQVLAPADISPRGVELNLKLNENGGSSSRAAAGQNRSGSGSGWAFYEQPHLLSGAAAAQKRPFQPTWSAAKAAAAPHNMAAPAAALKSTAAAGAPLSSGAGAEAASSTSGGSTTPIQQPPAAGTAPSAIDEKVVAATFRKRSEEEILLALNINGSGASASSPTPAPPNKPSEEELLATLMAAQPVDEEAEKQQQECETSSREHEEQQQVVAPCSARAKSAAPLVKQNPLGVGAGADRESFCSEEPSNSKRNAAMPSIPKTRSGAAASRRNNPFAMDEVPSSPDQDSMLEIDDEVDADGAVEVEEGFVLELVDDEDPGDAMGKEALPDGVVEDSHSDDHLAAVDEIEKEATPSPQGKGTAVPTAEKMKSGKTTSNAPETTTPAPAAAAPTSTNATRKRQHGKNAPPPPRTKAGGKRPQSGVSTGASSLKRGGGSFSNFVRMQREKEEQREQDNNAVNLNATSSDARATRTRVGTMKTTSLKFNSNDDSDSQVVGPSSSSGQPHAKKTKARTNDSKTTAGIMVHEDHPTAPVTKRAKLEEVNAKNETTSSDPPDGQKLQNSKCTSTPSLGIGNPPPFISSSSASKSSASGAKRVVLAPAASSTSFAEDIALVGNGSHGKGKGSSNKGKAAKSPSVPFPFQAVARGPALAPGERERDPARPPGTEDRSSYGAFSGANAPAAFVKNKGANVKPAGSNIVYSTAQQHSGSSKSNVNALLMPPPASANKGPTSGAMTSKNKGGGKGSSSASSSSAPLPNPTAAVAAAFVASAGGVGVSASSAPPPQVSMHQALPSVVGGSMWQGTHHGVKGKGGGPAVGHAAANGKPPFAAHQQGGKMNSSAGGYNHLSKK